MERETPVNTIERSLSSSKLASSKGYREAFVAAFLKRHIPFQIRTIRKKKNLSQQELASDSKVSQGVISRAEDPDYGNLTFNTVLRIAAGFDLAFVGKFVPFSALLDTIENLSEDSMEIASFEEECSKENSLAAPVGASVELEDPAKAKLLHGCWNANPPSLDPRPLLSGTCLYSERATASVPPTLGVAAPKIPPGISLINSQRERNVA